jgi:hypothetical protein
VVHSAMQARYQEYAGRGRSSSCGPKLPVFDRL